MRIGPCMQSVVYYVSCNPGLAMMHSARYVGPHGSLSYGYRSVHRAIKAGLVRAVRGPRGATLLYPAEMPDVKARALAAHLGVPADTISNIHGDTYESTDEPGEYLVLTDSEADQVWEEELDRYLDECVLSNIEGPLAQYFDCDAWKCNAKHDGRGHSLSSYDGTEHEVKIDGEWIYIYRVN